MTVSHQIGEALWARYNIRCPDLSLKVELDPDTLNGVYCIRVRTASFSRAQETYYIRTAAMKAQGLGPLICDVFDEIDRDLVRHPPALTDHHP